MPSRPAITVLLLTRQKVHRADFASLSAAPEVTERERPDAPDLASVLESVLVDGPPPGKKTFVLATDFWLQTANLPASRAAGMSEADIAAGLNFEAEVLSGLPALESAVAITPLPPAGGERRYLLLQIPFAVRDAIERVLAERGAKLAGLTHPAALPRSLGKRDLALQRLELWPDIAVGLRPTGTGFDADISNADPSTARWQTDLSGWAGEEVLLGPGITAPTGVTSVELTEPARLAAWFAGWAEELGARRPRAAVLRAPAKPTPPAVRFAIGAVLAAAAAGLAFFVWSSAIKQPLEDARTRTATAKDAAKQLADLQARENEEKKKAEEHAKEAAKFDLLAAQVEAHHTRFSRLLVALAADKPTDVMISKIDNEGGEPKVFGMALRPEMADDYVRGLTPLLRDLGWEVQSPKKTLKASNDGVLYEFEIEMQRLPEPKALQPATQKTPRAPKSPMTAARGGRP